MAVSIFVMPLRTWLEGSFQATWGPGAPGPTRPRRSEDEAEREVEKLRNQLGSQLGRRPDWDESGPLRSATTLSADGFARPFLKARQESFRHPFPRLSVLEPPQIWLPLPFEGVLLLEAPWEGAGELAMVSSSGLQEELVRLLEVLAQDPAMEELEGLSTGASLTGLAADFYELLAVTRRLRELAAMSLEHRAPVIVES